MGLVRLLGIAGAAGAIFFLGTFVSLHWLDPSLDIVRNYVSEFANGAYGPLFQIALMIHGLGNLAIAGAFFVIAKSRAGRVAAALFGLAAVGILVASIFATDPPGGVRTTAGTIHSFAAFAAFPIETISLLAFAHVFRRLPSWNSFAELTILVTFLSIASLLWLLIAIVVGLPPGLAERASLVILMVWEIFAGLRLAHSSPEEAETNARRP